MHHAIPAMSGGPLVRVASGEKILEPFHEAIHFSCRRVSPEHCRLDQIGAWNLGELPVNGVLVRPFIA